MTKKKKAAAAGSKYGAVPGHIPEKIRLEIRQGSKYSREYFDMSVNADTDDFDKLDLLPEKTKFAQMFAPKKSTSYYKDKKKHTYIDNKPIKIKLAAAEQNSIYRGGTKEAVMVYIPQGYIVQIGADVLFESLMRDGFNSETKELNSEFIIATYARNTKLIRVGSDLHNACLERMEALNRPKIDVKTMNAGEVFETAAGTRACFLGFVTTKYLKTEKAKNKKGRTVKYSTMKIGTLWLTDIQWFLDMSSSKKLQADFDGRLRSSPYFMSYVKFKPKSGHGYVTRCKNLRIDVPNDIIRSVRLDAITKQQQRLKQYKGKDCARFEQWLAMAVRNKATMNQQNRIRGFHYGNNSYGSPNYFDPPSSYDLQKMIGLTKKTNMTVFGMKPEAHETSVQIEKVVELFNQAIALNLDFGFDDG